MNRAATLAGGGAILLWAFLALLSRAASGIPPLQLTAMAFAVSGGAGLAWLAVCGQFGVLLQGWKAWLHGVGGLFGYHALYFAGLAWAPPATANLINYTWPLLIVLLSAPALGLRLTWRHALGTLLALAGCATLLGGGAAFPAGAWLGYACAASAAVVWATYSFLARRFQRVPAAALAGFCAGTSVLAWLAHLAAEPTVAPDLAAALAVLALGAGPLGTAFVLWDHGMKRGDPRLLGTLAFSTPVLSTLLLAGWGLAPLTGATVVAAALVALGGWVAGREQAAPFLAEP
jgi:drug/metabolite transporter (DMT)-like permease